MDKLDELFFMQGKLNDYIVNKRNLPSMVDESNSSMWIQRQMVAMMSECAEVLDEINFKWWKNESTIDRCKLKEELVDVGHFFVSMCITAGMTSAEFMDIYRAKNQENINRQDGLSKKEGYN